MIGLKAAVLGAALCFSVSEAQARPRPSLMTISVLCEDERGASERLREVDGKEKVWWGLSSKGHLLIIYQSKDGLWSATFVHPSGMGCVISTGTDGVIIHPDGDTGPGT